MALLESGSTSVSRFRRLHAGDQGAHCRPWTPASLLLCSRVVRGQASEPAEGLT